MSSNLWSKSESFPLIITTNDELNDGNSNKLRDDINDWSDQELDDLFQSPIEEVLDSMRYSSSKTHISRRHCLRSVIYLSLISFVFGLSFATLFITGYQSISNQNNFNQITKYSQQFQASTTRLLNTRPLVTTPSTTGDIRDKLFNEISSKRIAQNLKTLTKKPIIGETFLDENTLYVYNKWKQLGLNTSFANYTVLLSYQNVDKPNLVSKVSKSGQITHNSSQFEDPLNAPPELAQYYRQNPPFLAYSPATDTPVKGYPVYVNYGRPEDYDYLNKINVSVKGSIVIARYATIFRANIVKLAEENGAIGVIIYSDPFDYTDGNTSNTYPNSVYLPQTGVQRGTIKIVEGDPQTPFYPSIESAYRLAINETNLPRIPAQCISYGDAKFILEGLKGPKAPDSWSGKLNITYNIGAGYEDESYITLEVNTFLKQSVIHNVIATIIGCTEPDRYVLVGNHRDAWTLGAVDPLSGTAAMLELSEAFATVMKSEKWCPRRSIVFCSWAAEEYGLVGSHEWVEENQKLLISQAIAYLNVDIAVSGNYTFHADSVPLLYQTVWEATKVVPNPNPEEVKEGFKTVFDSYAHHRPSNMSGNLPVIGAPGSGSDHTSFLQVTGTPVVNFYFDCDTNTHIRCFPLYHTMYETYDLMSNLTDRGFRYSKALTEIWAEMLRSLSDTPLLPFIDSLKYYPYFLNKAFIELNGSQYKDIFVENNISLRFLDTVIKEFNEEIEGFYNRNKRLDEKNPLALRSANDIMMYLERAFLDAQGLPYRQDKKHIVLTPSSFNAYSGTSFAGLYDLLWHYRHESIESEKPNILKEIKKHLSVIVFHINAAKLLMKQSFN